MIESQKKRVYEIMLLLWMCAHEETDSETEWTRMRKRDRIHNVRSLVGIMKWRVEIESLICDAVFMCSVCWYFEIHRTNKSDPLIKIKFVAGCCCCCCCCSGSISYSHSYFVAVAVVVVFSQDLRETLISLVAISSNASYEGIYWPFWQRTHEVVTIRYLMA